MHITYIVVYWYIIIPFFERETNTFSKIPHSPPGYFVFVTTTTTNSIRLTTFGRGLFVVGDDQGGTVGKVSWKERKNIKVGSRVRLWDGWTSTRVCVCVVFENSDAEYEYIMSLTNGWQEIRTTQMKALKATFRPLSTSIQYIYIYIYVLCMYKRPSLLLFRRITE